MTIERMGLGGVLTFNAGAALGSMGRASGGFRRLHQSATLAARGVGQIGRAMGGAALALAPLAAGMAFAGNSAATFEHQMRAVQAVAGGTADDMARMTLKAKEMGAKTKFTAIEAGQGMELLARAGANADQVLAAIDGTMQAAAADGIDLATATDVITQTTRGMGLTWSDTGRVADVLALGSARANTSIVGLGNAMTYASAQARVMGVPLEQTVASLAKMSDAGLDGTLAGTSFTQMMVKLGKPSKTGAALLEKWGIALTTTAGKMVSMPRLLEQFQTKISAIKDPVKRAAAMTELFGVRGQKAYAALAAQGPDALKQLIIELESSKGAAENMAKTRLDSFIGQVSMVKSAAEGLSIEIFEPLLGPMKEGAKDMATFVGDIVVGIQQLKAGKTTTNAFAKGIFDATNLIVDGFMRARTFLTDLRKNLTSTFGPNTIERLAKMATIFAVVSGALAPVGIALAGLALVFTMVLVPAASGVVSILGAIASVLMGPVGVALAAAIAAIYVLGDEQESFGETSLRIWGVVRDVVVDFWRNTIQPFFSGVLAGAEQFFLPIKAVWGEIITSIKFLFEDLMQTFFGGTSQMQTDWLEVGKTVGATLADLIGTVMNLAHWIIRVGVLAVTSGAKIVKFLGDNLFTIFRRIINATKQIVDGFREIFSGNILSGLQKLHKGLLDYVLMPIRHIVAGAIKLADAVGLPVGSAIRQFAAEGAGAILPETPKKKATKALAAAAEAKKEEKDSKPEVKVDITDNSKIDVKSTLEVDGREIAYTSAKHNQEILERAGARSTPWQRELAVTYGVSR